MFKNLCLYRFGAEWMESVNLADIEKGMQNEVYAPCTPSQAESVGWVPPRLKEHGALVESVAGHWIARIRFEKKAVPGAVIKRHVEERAAKIEEMEGRKPGKKELRDIRDEVLQELLPKAFSKISDTLVWIDKNTRLLAIASTSSGTLDKIVTRIISALANASETTLVLHQVHTNHSPAQRMVGWLTQFDDDDGKFEVGHECELKAADESKATVKYKRLHLDREEIRQHIREGKLPTSLSLVWDGRVAFTLNEKMHIKSIAFAVPEDQSADAGMDANEDAFDADVALSCGDLALMIPDLIKELGGELDAAAEEQKNSDSFEAAMGGLQALDEALSE